MTHFKLPTFKYLQEVKCPITIFHGSDDEVIPYDNGSKLTKFFKQEDELITIKNGGHNNLNDFALFHQKLDSLL